MKNSKHKQREFIGYFFTLILTVMLTFLIACIGVGFGALSSRSFLTNLNKSEYYKGVYKELRERAEVLVTKAGLPTEVLADVITLERVAIAGRSYVEGVLKGEKPEVKTKMLREDFELQLDSYFMEQEITLTEEGKSELENLISVMEADYKGAIELPLTELIASYQTKFHKLMFFVLPVLFLVIGALCYFLVRMHRHKHRGVRNIAYAFLASSCITIMAAGYLLFTKQYGKIDVMPDYYQRLITTLLKWDIKIFIYIGGFGLTLSAVLISLIGFLKNRRNN